MLVVKESEEDGKREEDLTANDMRKMRIRKQNIGD